MIIIPSNSNRSEYAKKNFHREDMEISFRTLWMAKNIISATAHELGIPLNVCYENKRSRDQDLKIFFETLGYIMAFVFKQLRDDIEKNHGWTDKSHDLNLEYQVEIGLSFSKELDRRESGSRFFFDLFTDYYTYKRGDDYIKYWDIDNQINEDEMNMINDDLLKNNFKSFGDPKWDQNYSLERLYTFRIDKITDVVDRKKVIFNAVDRYRNIGLYYYNQAIFKLNLNEILNDLKVGINNSGQDCNTIKPKRGNKIKTASKDTNGCEYNQEDSGRNKIPWHGGSYVGPLKNKRPYGQGSWSGFEGSKYEGQYYEGLKHGNGIYTWASGEVYQGEWKYGLRDGLGKLIWADGAFYDGEWKKGQAHGMGKRIFADGSLYDGEWKEGKPHGRGTLSLPNKAKYIGKWANGKLNGKGRVTYPSGDIYEGEFRNGKRDGQGKYIYADNIEIAGEWIDGKLIRPLMKMESSIVDFENQQRKDKSFGTGINSSGMLKEFKEQFDYSECLHCGEKTTIEVNICKYCQHGVTEESVKEKNAEKSKLLKDHAHPNKIKVENASEEIIVEEKAAITHEKPSEKSQRNGQVFVEEIFTEKTINQILNGSIGFKDLTNVNTVTSYSVIWSVILAGLTLWAIYMEAIFIVGLFMFLLVIGFLGIVIGFGQIDQDSNKALKEKKKNYAMAKVIKQLTAELISCESIPLKSYCANCKKGLKHIEEDMSRKNIDYRGGYDILLWKNGSGIHYTFSFNVNQLGLKDNFYKTSNGNIRNAVIDKFQEVLPIFEIAEDEFLYYARKDLYNRSGLQGSSGGLDYGRAVAGDLLFGESGAVVPSYKSKVNANTTELEKRETVLYYMYKNEVFDACFEKEAYDILKELLPCDESILIYRLSKMYPGKADEIFHMNENLTSAGDDINSKFEKLTNLKEKGIITDEEFTEKMKYLMDQF